MATALFGAASAGARSARPARSAHRARADSLAYRGADSLLWGAVTGNQFDGGQTAPWDMRVLSDFSSADARSKGMSLVPMYSAFASCTPACAPVAFPAQTLSNIRSYGAIPMISWSSAALQDGNYLGVRDSRFSLKAVVEGKLDRYIVDYARAAKAWGHPFFLRFDWEMNGSWFVWGNGTNGNTAREFVLAWRHVWNVFHRVGATNVSWVWCPNNGNDHGQVSNLASFYPGARYVSWTCMDAYNYGATNGGSWESWDQVARPAYDKMVQIAPTKPMMVAEFASDTEGGSQAAWLANALSEVPREYPYIHAMVLYDTSSQWEIESNLAAKTAFAAGIANPAYTSNTFGGLTGAIPAP